MRTEKPALCRWADGSRDSGATVESADISEALDDMLFAGGKLNVKLLGGVREIGGE